MLLLVLPGKRDVWPSRRRKKLELRRCLLEGVFSGEEVLNKKESEENDTAGACRRNDLDVGGEGVAGGIDDS